MITKRRIITIFYAVLQMVDQSLDESSQTALPAEENTSKPEGSEKESTQVIRIVITHVSFFILRT